MSQQDRRTTTIKILGKEYKLSTDAPAEHLEDVAEYVDRVLREVGRTTSDTQDAAILAALNIASELLRGGQPLPVSAQRIQALIDRIDSV